MQIIILIMMLLQQQEGLACSPSTVYPNTTYPADGSVDVARDSRIYVEFKGAIEEENCCNAEILMEDRLLEGTYETICNDLIGWNLRCHTVFSPDSTLPPETTFVVKALWGGGEMIYGFTTGSGYAETSQKKPKLFYVDTNFVDADDFCGIEAFYDVRLIANDTEPVEDGTSFCMSIKQMQEEKGCCS